MRKVSYERGGVSGLEETTRERDRGIIEGGGGGGVVRAFLHAFLLLALSYLCPPQPFPFVALGCPCVRAQQSLRVDWLRCVPWWSKEDLTGNRSSPYVSYRTCTGSIIRPATATLDQRKPPPTHLPPPPPPPSSILAPKCSAGISGCR